MRRGRFTDALPRIEKAIDDALKESVEAVADRARDLAPKDSGELADSINTAKTGDLQYAVTVGADYGSIVEYGSEHQPARPFLRIAFDSEEEATYKRLEKAIKA